MTCRPKLDEVFAYWCDNGYTACQKHFRIGGLAMMNFRSQFTAKQHRQLAQASASRRSATLKTVHNSKTLVDMPAGFLETSRGMSDADLGRIYKVRQITIQRWVGELPLAEQYLRDMAPETGKAALPDGRPSNINDAAKGGWSADERSAYAAAKAGSTALRKAIDRMLLKRAKALAL